MKPPYKTGILNACTCFSCINFWTLLDEIGYFRSIQLLRILDHSTVCSTQMTKWTSSWIKKLKRTLFSRFCIYDMLINGARHQALTLYIRFPLFYACRTAGYSMLWRGGSIEIFKHIDDRSHQDKTCKQRCSDHHVLYYVRTNFISFDFDFLDFYCNIEEKHSLNDQRLFFHTILSQQNSAKRNCIWS